MCPHHRRPEDVLAAFVDVEDADQHRFDKLDAAEHGAAAVGALVFELDFARELTAPGDRAAVTAPSRGWPGGSE
jgi:hypothetical protein